MIKLVAFDWNGTLFADTYTVFKSAQDAYKFLGIKDLTFAKFQKLFTVPVVDFYVAAGANREFVLNNSKKVADIFHNNYENAAEKCRTRQHAKLVLELLNKNKIACVLFSNHTFFGVEKQLKRLKLEKYFTKVIANELRDSSIKGEPKKIKLHTYLSSKKISTKDTLIVGDAIEEIEIAKDFGAISVALTHGNYSKERLKEAKPDYLISDLGNLINIIREINSA